MELILASTSPRRRELLARAGFRFAVCAPRVEESAVAARLAGRPPEELARELALCKAREVAARHPGAAVLGADTVVAADGRVFGKPAGPEEARAMLARLSGREHVVSTGVAVVAPGGVSCGVSCGMENYAVSTAVRFFPLSEREIDWYVATGEPLDKAGAYGIQGLGALLVECIRGDYYAVVGLPLARAARSLRRLGIFPQENAGNLPVK